MNEEYIVSTRSGKVRGYVQGHTIIYKGIPYAAPPVGENRFSPPQPVKNWDGILDAFQSSPVVPQPPPAPELRAIIHEQSEANCLTINIWTPGLDHKKRPVLFWIHGGSLLTGSNADFNGQPMSSRGDVVVVAINYRLGAFGFLYVPGITANSGLLDQVAALEWVARNIEHFGGDPSNVTIFGESAGGLCVSALMTIPRAKGLFKRAIMQSNVCNPDCSQPEKGVIVSKRLFSILEIKYGDMDAIRKVPPENLITAYQQAVATRVWADTYPPFVDGDVLPVHPYESIKQGFASNIEIIAGTNENESGLFSLWDPNVDKLNEDQLKNRLRYSRNLAGETDERVDELYKVYVGSLKPAPFDTLRYAWEQYNTDQLFRVPVHRYLEAQSKYQPHVYAYQFSWQTPELGGKLGAAHALEIPFVFHTLGKEPFGIFPKQSVDTDKLSYAMLDAWVNFARRGDPNHKNIPDWAIYNANTHPTMVFDNQIYLDTNLYPLRDKAWQNII